MHEGKLPVGPIMPDMNRAATGTSQTAEEIRESSVQKTATSGPSKKHSGGEVEESSEDSNSRPTSAPSSLDMSSRLFSFSHNLVGGPATGKAAQTSIGTSSKTSGDDRLPAFYGSEALSTSPPVPINQMRPQTDLRQRTDSIDKFLSQSPSHALGRKRINPVGSGAATDSDAHSSGSNPSFVGSGLPGSMGRGDDAMQYINVQSPGQTLNLRKRMVDIDFSSDGKLETQSSKLGQSATTATSQTRDATGTEKTVTSTSFSWESSSTGRTSPFQNPLTGGFSALSSSFEALNLSKPSSSNAANVYGNSNFKEGGSITNPVGTRARSTSPTTVAKFDSIFAEDSVKAKNADDATNNNDPGFGGSSQKYSSTLAGSRVSSSLEGPLVSTRGESAFDSNSRSRSVTPPNGSFDELGASLAKRGTSATIAPTSAPSTPSAAGSYNPVPPGQAAQRPSETGSGLYLGGAYQGSLDAFGYPAIGGAPQSAVSHGIFSSGAGMMLNVGAGSHSGTWSHPGTQKNSGASSGQNPAMDVPEFVPANASNMNRPQVGGAAGFRDMSDSRINEASASGFGDPYMSNAMGVGQSMESMYYPAGPMGMARGVQPMMPMPIQNYGVDSYTGHYGYADSYVGGYGMSGASAAVPNMGGKGGLPGHNMHNYADQHHQQQPQHYDQRQSNHHPQHSGYKGNPNGRRNQRNNNYREDSIGYPQDNGQHLHGTGGNGRRNHHGGSYGGMNNRGGGGGGSSNSTSNNGNAHGQYYNNGQGTGSNANSHNSHGPGVMIPVDTPLDDCVGQVFQLSQEQNGCRYLQQKVDFEGTTACTKILAEVKPRLTQLMMDPFGNYLFQKLLEHASWEQRGEMLSAVKVHLVHAALNLHGTRSVQKFIEVCGRENDDVNMAILVEYLSPFITKLSMDTNGNHVVQRCLQYMSSATAQFVYDTVIRDVLVITRHRHGCCVFQRCIDAANPTQRDALVQQVISHSIQLMQDPFGNYVVQYVLERSQEGETQALIQQLLGGLAHLSMQKFSSNVVEKCLQAAPRETLGPMIKELAEANTMRNMLHDQFANYVVQRALLVANDEQGMQLVNSIRPHLAGLGSFNPSCARRVANRVVKRFPKVASDPVFREFLHLPESGAPQAPQHSQ